MGKIGMHINNTSIIIPYNNDGRKLGMESSYYLFIQRVNQIGESKLCSLSQVIITQVVALS